MEDSGRKAAVGLKISMSSLGGLWQAAAIYRVAPTNILGSEFTGVLAKSCPIPSWGRCRKAAIPFSPPDTELPRG